MLKYFSKSTFTLSLVLGVLCYPFVIWFADKNFAFLFSVLFCIAMAIVIPGVLWFDDTKYRNIESEIKEKVLQKQDIAIRTATGLQTGKAFLTSSELYIFSAVKKPYFYTVIRKEQVHNYDLKNGVQLVFSLKDQGQGMAYMVLESSTVKEIKEGIDSLNWVPVEWRH